MRRRKLSFEYEFKVVFKNKERGLDKRHFTTDTANVVSKAHAFTVEAIKSEGNIQRTKVVALYSTLKQADRFTVDVKNDKDFEACLE